jgi:hypothetical protein
MPLIVPLLPGPQEINEWKADESRGKRKKETDFLKISKVHREEQDIITILTAALRLL